MSDPGKLVASATRLYGDAMDRLWGEIAPVPRDAVVPLQGGCGHAEDRGAVVHRRRAGLR